MLNKHLENRIASRVSLRVDFFDDALERQVLMRVGFETDFTHALEKLGERRIAGQIGAQSQSVNEKADEPLQLGTVTARDGRADDDVVLPGETREKNFERGQQDHEQRDLLFARKLLQREVSSRDNRSVTLAPR